MYINDKTDKELLRRLWKSRIADEKRMKKGDLDDGCHFGILFDSLFDDINETLLFQQNAHKIDVYADPMKIKKWGPVGSKEMVYGLYSEEIKLKIDIIERIQLLRQLEEHRLAVWDYDGRDSRDYRHSSTVCISSFYGNEDAAYIQEHLNETLVPTKHLKEFIERDFMDNEEHRNRKMLCRSNITMWVAVLTLVVAIISMSISKNTNTSKYNERVGLENGQNDSLQHQMFLKTDEKSVFGVFQI